MHLKTLAVGGEGDGLEAIRIKTSDLLMFCPLLLLLFSLASLMCSEIFQSRMQVLKKKKGTFKAKQTGFQLLGLLLTNGTGALSTVRDGNVNHLKNTNPSPPAKNIGYTITITITIRLGKSHTHTVLCLAWSPEGMVF